MYIRDHGLFFHKKDDKIIHLCLYYTTHIFSIYLYIQVNLFPRSSNWKPLRLGRFQNLLKYAENRIYIHRYKTRQDARTSILKYMELF
jgi:hypothetical protein